MFLPAEISKVKHAFSRPRERHAHAVEHLNQLRRGFNHALDGDLVSQKVAAVNRVVEMLVNAVVFALGIHTGVDAALRAERMRTLNRAVRK